MMIIPKIVQSVIFLILLLSCSTIHAQAQKSDQEVISSFISFLTDDQIAQDDAYRYLEKTWTPAYIPPILDVIFLADKSETYQRLFSLLQQNTGQNFGGKLFDWMVWMWNQDQELLPYQAEFMSALHKNIDPKFEKYFKGRQEQTLIRLDEIRWGGVRQDGIPPLRYPKMITASEEDYLDDDNIIFGIEVNGETRAYPKRILAWHEMFVDTVQSIPLAGVYCTLCGTVILYKTEHNGINHEIGTSGFLYRSNKLMYDKATQSLWNTIEGKPVLGPLVNQGIELESMSVVTTTWKEWKKMHPKSLVLSLDTGHNRDYSEGAAYARYFATDDLMFRVPKLDDRLKNKSEVLIIRSEGYETDPLAISAKYLKKNKIYHDQINGTSFVVITDKAGGNRVYESGQVKFKKINKQNKIVDSNGKEWTQNEHKLVSPSGESLDSLPYHRIFWFAWYNTYPDTRLVK